MARKGKSRRTRALRRAFQRDLSPPKTSTKEVSALVDDKREEECVSEELVDVDGAAKEKPKTAAPSSTSETSESATVAERS